MADKKFTDLVANADTNLTVAAVGDYLLIYDVSEPLDINKIKVISIDDFQDSIKTPIITARQGGDGTDWSIPGTTNYTISDVPLIFLGKLQLSLSGASGIGQGIYFPSAFATKPFVLVASELISGTGLVVPYYTNLTTTGMTVGIKEVEGTSHNTVANVSWFAVALSA